MLLDNIVIRVLSRVFDLILLNILWLLCSLPLVTIGASVTALYSVTLKMVANEEGYIVKGFWYAFKNNFKQSTIVWLILMVIGMALGADFMILSRFMGMFSKVGMVLLGVVTVIYLTELIFVFPLVARFKNTTFGMMKNALLIPLARLPYMLAVSFLIIVCLILTLLNQVTIMVGAVIWSVIGGALLAFANSFLIRRMFKPFEEGGRD